MMKPDTPPVLLCTDTFVAEHGARLADVAPDVDVVELGESNDIGDVDRDRITIAFLSKDTWPERFRPFLDVARASPRLDWLHVMSAGVEGAIFQAFRDRGVTVTRTAGASASAIAETVFMYLHALSRDVRAHNDLYAAREWRWETWRQLEGRRVTVLGYGPIAQRIIHLALAYDMIPTAVRRSVRGDEMCATRVLDDLADAVADADVVVVALPLNPDTHGLVSRDVIRRCKAGAILVNVSRGPIVAQAALTEALVDGHLGGAGLDVFDPEPLAADDPLWDLPNVILTPHNSGSSNLGPRKVADIFFEHLELYLRHADFSTLNP